DSQHQKKKLTRKNAATNHRLTGSKNPSLAARGGSNLNPKKCNPPCQKSRPARTVAACSRKHRVANSDACLVCYVLGSAAKKKRCRIRHRMPLNAACALVFMRLIAARTEVFTNWVAERWVLHIAPLTRRFSVRSR